MATGKGDRENSIRFALSPEEAGLILDQLPENDVELARSGGPGYEEVPDKVFRIAPLEDGAVSFIIDFEKHGVGGMMPDSQAGSGPGPLEVCASAGEFVVFRELVKSTIPTLTGWSEMLEIAINNRKEGAKPAGGPPPPSDDSFGLPF